MIDFFGANLGTYTVPGSPGVARCRSDTAGSLLGGDNSGIQTTGVSPGALPNNRSVPRGTPARRADPVSKNRHPALLDRVQAMAFQVQRKPDVFQQRHPLTDHQTLGHRLFWTRVSPASHVNWLVQILRPRIPPRLAFRGCLCQSIPCPCEWAAVDPTNLSPRPRAVMAAENSSSLPNS